MYWPPVGEAKPPDIQQIKIQIRHRNKRLFRKIKMPESEIIHRVSAISLNSDRIPHCYPIYFGSETEKFSITPVCQFNWFCKDFPTK